MFASIATDNQMGIHSAVYMRHSPMHPVLASILWLLKNLHARTDTHELMVIIRI